MTLIYFSSSFSQHLTWRDIQHLIVRSSQPLDPVGRYALRWRPRPNWRINGANVLGICQFPSKPCFTPTASSIYSARSLSFGHFSYLWRTDFAVRGDINFCCEKKIGNLLVKQQNIDNEENMIFSTFSTSTTQGNCPVDDSWITNLWKAQ